DRATKFILGEKNFIKRSAYYSEIEGNSKRFTLVKQFGKFKTYAVDLDSYVQAPYDPALMVMSIYNDLEGELGEQWNNKNTVSEDQARSGDRASSTGRGRAFSITYKDIMGNLKGDLLTAEAWVYHDGEIDPEAVMVVSLASKEGIYSYNQVYLSKSVNVPGRWGLVVLQTELPAQEKGVDNSQDKFNFYIWSPAEKRIFIDDIELKFFSHNIN
ncbi:MAG: hypothetical protein IH946_00995, partial [Bacteroidetes bacterium]|nr:hypothetical protein [Bacteroidota bacterium]